jgi:hypothetical protein
VTSRRADKKRTPNRNIARGSVKLTFRDKKLVRAIDETLTFLSSLSKAGVAECSLARMRQRDSGLGKVATFLSRIASGSEIPEAIRQDARAMAETASRIAGRLPIYEAPPVMRREARRLASRLEAATMRGTGSSTLLPGDAGRLVSLIDRKIKTGMSQREAAESLSERFHLSPSRLGQIYRQTRARLERAA